MVPSAQQFLDDMATDLEQAIGNMKRAQAAQAKYANKKRRHVTYSVNDQVLLSTAYLNLASQSQRPTRKFSPRFVGPFRVIQVISPVTYKLELPPTLRVHSVFHVSLLKPYHQSATFPQRNPPPPPPVSIDDHEEFEVERILDSRTRYRRIEYLVKWKGYPDYDATWEPSNNLLNAQQAIHDFNIARAEQHIQRNALIDAHFGETVRQ